MLRYLYVRKPLQFVLKLLNIRDIHPWNGTAIRGTTFPSSFGSTMKIVPIRPETTDYLQDESRLRGAADEIALPETEEEVCALLASGTPVTLQGARTGITGGAVPMFGRIINLSNMNSIGEPENGFITVGPGARLCDVRKKLEDTDLFFPPDPTEDTASLGGMAACNASGARSFKYGPTRNHIEALRVVFADGTAREIRRGEPVPPEIPLPAYRLPNVKNAAGYFVADKMDFLDLFVGAEGTLGILTELTLKLSPLPEAIWGLTAFLPSEKAALDFVQKLRTETTPAAIEFFDVNALNLLRKNPDLPKLPPESHTAIYAEFHGTDNEVEAAVEKTVEMIPDPDTAWIATEPAEMEKLRLFRHALPEAVNQRIADRKKEHPELTKLGTDMSVPDERLGEIMALYRQGLERENLEHVIFGHIGNNHLHVNILPRSPEEYERGKTLYVEWAKQVVDMGGSVSAEHGIGKLKRGFLKIMFGNDGIEQMRALKAHFDPKGLLNPGNLF